MGKVSLSKARRSLLPVAFIERRIHVIRGLYVMLDRDLAELYGVRPIALRQAIKRKQTRFPTDFMFRLSREEAHSLVSQTVIPSLRSLGGFLPCVFTQEGVAMLSSVLTSKRAVQVNIAIMRAFIQYRQYAANHERLARKIDALERKFADHDGDIQKIFGALRQLLTPPKATRPIGFRARD